MIAHGNEFFRAAYCSDPDCAHTTHPKELFLNASCHPGAGIEAMYRDGVIYFYCHQCFAFVIAAALARDSTYGDESARFTPLELLNERNP